MDEAVGLNSSMIAVNVNEAQERVAQLAEVVAGFEVSRSQLRAKLELNPSMRIDLQRKIDLNTRTLESLYRSLAENRELLRRLVGE